jgi:FkbM family methyltransferase
MDQNKLINLGKGLSHFFHPEMPLDIVIDGGANEGHFVEKLRELNVNAKIICVEPSKHNIDILRKKNFENIIIEESALLGINPPSSIIYTEIIGLSEWGGVKGKNTAAAIKRGCKTINYRVKAISLETLFKTYELGKIDYLKMDIEGAETDVILTMTKELASKIKQISFEVHNNDSNLLEKAMGDLGYDTIFKEGEIYAIFGGDESR